MDAINRETFAQDLIEALREERNSKPSEKRLTDDELADDALFEMSNFHKLDSGLPANLWLPDTNCAVEHNAPRIKFQGDTNVKIKKDNLIPISISENPEILIGNANFELSSKELEQIKKFIVKYKNELMDLQNDDTFTFGKFLKAFEKRGGLA